MRDTDVGY